MATMYETIMNLPLFKGLSHEQVSSFLEKTHFKFSKYSDREKIVSAGECVEEVKCVISGQIRLCHIIGDKDLLRLTELRRNHEVIGADRLFGMDTTYGADICAVGNVSTMEFSKNQYQNLLNAGSIYLLNYLNSLSYGAQIRFNIFNDYPQGGFAATCRRIIHTYCSRNSEEISFFFNPKSFAGFCNIDTNSFKKEIIDLESIGAIKQIPGGFTIVSEEKFFEA